MSRTQNLRPTVVKLWLQLISLGIVGCVFCMALWLAMGKVQGWTFYLNSREVAFEIAVRIIFAALAGIVLGTLCSLAVAPFLWYFQSARERIAEGTRRAAAFVTVFFASRYALIVIIAWSQSFLHRGLRFESALLTVQFLVFAVALGLPRLRRKIGTSLDGFQGEKMTRRTAIATVAGAAALATVEFALSKRIPAVRAALASSRPKSNLLLITFDALSAEDMSLYGYGLPTTPNIDAFARKATVFNNFYSACTFTTPCVATILTGLYPSESRIYQMQGQIRPNDRDKVLPNLMRTGGYTTGAFFSNPYPYYFAKNLGNAFDVLPAPIYQPGGLQHLWDATTPLHQESGIGSRVEEYADLIRVWNPLWKIPTSLWLQYRAVASFEHARELLATSPEGQFLWIHVMTPHDPYLPDSADRGRFLPDEQLRGFELEEEVTGRRWYPRYEPAQQGEVSLRRLGYDEFVATADRAFGDFMSDLESSGRLRDTTVIISADHGESFEGGVYQHSSPYLTRPVIHVPLVIRTPGQSDGRKVAVTADQTSLAPTILELAGVSVPASMRSQSLVPWLNRDGQGTGEGIAFTQYFERNSVFKPPHRGSIGVIDGQYQYVYYLDKGNGKLRPLNEAQIWNIDRSAEDPGRAEAMRSVLHKRFPDLVQETT